MKRRDFLKVGIGSAILFMIPKFAFGDSPETIFEKRFARGEKIESESHTFNRGIVLRGKGRVLRCYFKFTSTKDDAFYFPNSFYDYRSECFTQNIISLGKVRGPRPGPDTWR